MRVELELPATAALGEAPTCAVRVTNDGPDPVDAPPAALEVLGPDGPVEARPDRAPPRALAPGEAHERRGSLLERFDPDRPGPWLVTAVVGDARSTTARLEVRPPAPGALVPEAGSLDRGALWVAWTDERPDGDAPATAVLVRRVTLTELGDLEHLPPAVRAGTSAGQGVQPLLSTPALGAPCAARHVAWVEERRLVVVTVDPRGDRVQASLELEVRGRVLGPPVAEPDGGATLLVALEPTGIGAELLVVEVAGAQARVAHRRLVGRQPAAWGRLLVEDGGRRALLAVPDAPKTGPVVRLLSLPWVEPRPGAPATPAATPARLAEQPGVFAAADLLLDPDAGQRGALLTWEARPLGPPRLLLATWGASGRLGRPAPWGWPERLVGAPLEARVDLQGAVHLLLLDGARWLHARTLERPAELLPRQGPFVGPPALTCLGAGPLVLWQRPDVGLVALGLGFRLQPSPDELVQPDLAPEPVPAGGGAQ